MGFMRASRAGQTALLLRNISCAIPYDCKAMQAAQVTAVKKSN